MNKNTQRRGHGAGGEIPPAPPSWDPPSKYKLVLNKIIFFKDLINLCLLLALVRLGFGFLLFPTQIKDFDSGWFPSAAPVAFSSSLGAGINKEIIAIQNNRDPQNRVAAQAAKHPAGLTAPQRSPQGSPK